jgi:hypothetical protein
VDQEFMVKPQPRIHPEHVAEVEDGDEEMVHVSLDFYHSKVLSRQEKGGEPSHKQPDFIVVKVTSST